MIHNQGTANEPDQPTGTANRIKLPICSSNRIEGMGNGSGGILQ